MTNEEKIDRLTTVLFDKMGTQYSSEFAVAVFQFCSTAAKVAVETLDSLDTEQ
jgi:hypothetical protein